MSAIPCLSIAAVFLVNDRQQTLLVRKQGTTAFMQPGGKIEPNESPRQAALREVQEELGIALELEEDWGCFHAPAANEARTNIEAHVFFARWNTPLQAHAELAEIRWVTLEEALALPLAPLTRDDLLPRWQAWLAQQQA